ncbi:MAG TPA: hypothetical protein VM012_03915 [Flavitalea sp.]|nr:hypothetical protein [Flavitalea sp.]
MTIEEKIQYKYQLKQFALEMIQRRAEIVKKIINNAQAAANSEEKSSAGDKYETGRAMAHLETDMHKRQLAEIEKELAALFTIDTSRLYDLASAGAFIQCGEVSFFIYAGLGKQMFNGNEILFLSPYAPLAKTIINKKASDTFQFKGTQIKIQLIF